MSGGDYSVDARNPQKTEVDSLVAKIEREEHEDPLSPDGAWKRLDNVK